MHEQLKLFSVEDDYFLSASSVRSVSDTELKASLTNSQTVANKEIERVSDRSASINKYSPGKRKTEYFRLSYRNGSKIKHVHIRGGNVSSALARNRVKQLTNMINRGASIQELIRLIANYR